DVTSRLAREGARFQPGELPGPLLLYVTGPTGMNVKRSAFGAEGLVLDHYQRSAADHYLHAVVEPMLRSAPGLVESVFCDSLEVYGANWTEDLPTVFERQRSYPLVPQLPALFDTDSTHGAEVRFDFWRTLSELTERRFTKHVSEWLHRHHVKLE